MISRVARFLVCTACMGGAALACSPKSDVMTDDGADDRADTGEEMTSTFTTSPADGADDGAEGQGDGGGDGMDAPDTGAMDDGADDADDGGAFVLPPDGGGASECDPTLQDCDRGEKCTAWANDGGTFWNANRCVEISGTGVAGDACMVEGNGVSGLDDCDLGFICMNTNEENIGTCIGFCSGNDRDCEAGNVCAIYNDGVLPICLVGCDPLLQDCPTGQGCIDTPNQSFICFNDASGAGGAVGEPCPAEDGENSCDPGLWCGTGLFGCNEVKCCTPYCDLSGPTCPTGNECLSFFGDQGSAPPGFADVGVCVVP